MSDSALQTPEKAFLNLDFLNSPSQDKVGPFDGEIKGVYGEELDERFLQSKLEY